MYWISYLAGMCALLAVVPFLWTAWRRWLRPEEALLAVLIQVASVLYLSALLPGMVGLLTPPAIAGVMVALCAVSAVVIRCLVRRASQAREAAGPAAQPYQAGETAPSRYDRGLIVAMGLGAIGLFPVPLFLAKLPLGFSEAAFLLEWDTVSGHLPGLVEFLQDRTLWSSAGAFSSYCYGFELLAALPIASFQSSWPLVGSLVFAAVFFYAALYVLSGHLAAALAAGRPGRPKPPTVVIFVLGAGLFSWLLAFELSRVGKNDVFQSACLLASLAGVLGAARARREGAPNLELRLQLVLAGLALGLALGTKPSALAYVPFLVLLAGAALFAGRGGRAQVRPALAAAASVGVIAALVGGFFHVKNLIQLGRLVPEELGRVAFGKTLWNAVTAGDVTVHYGSVATVVALLTLILSAALAWRARAPGESRWPLAALFAFHVTAALTFAITPLVAEGPQTWFIRLGIPFFAVSGLFASAVVAAGLSALSRSGPVWAWPATLSAAGLVVAVAVPLHFSTFTAIGLPGYEQIAGLPPTPVYRAVQQLESPARIYSAGLRPWGLYGPGFRHRVFYDLHANTEFYDHLNPRYLSAVLEQFRPTHLIIGVDPHGRSGGTPEKPAFIAWLREQACFKEVFNDPTVSVFEVHDGWQELVRRHPPGGGKIRMGF